MSSARRHNRKRAEDFHWCGRARCSRSCLGGVSESSCEKFSQAEEKQEEEEVREEEEAMRVNFYNLSCYQNDADVAKCIKLWVVSINALIAVRLNVMYNAQFCFKAF